MIDAAVYFLGIDGGGTGCRARLTDEAGRVLGTGDAGAATLRLGVARAWAALMQAAEAALHAVDGGVPKAKVHAAAGLAGVGRIGTLGRLQAMPHPYAAMAFTGDAEIAWLGAHGGRDGGVVIVGTGSIGYGEAGGRVLRAGGYGFPISDEGSGAELGIEAVRLALRAHDGRYVMTPLLAAILARYQSDPFEIVAWMDTAAAPDYAALAPLIVQHGVSGDVAGRALLTAAGARIAGLVEALFAQGAPRVALLGGLKTALEPWLPADVRSRLSLAEGDAIDGALLLARRCAQARLAS